MAVATAAVLVAGLSTASATAASASDAPPAPGVAPDAFTAFGGRAVDYTGTDGAVWLKLVGTTVSAFSLGGRLLSAPSAVLVGQTATAPVIFGEGADHALWRQVGFGEWRTLDGRLTSKPGAAVADAPTLDLRVYARGADGAVWARNHFGPLVDNPAVGWGPWHKVGGAVLAGTGPSAAVIGGRYYVLVTGTDHGLFLAEDNADRTNFRAVGFKAVGGRTNSTPALVDAPSSGSLVGFARGTDNAGWFNRFLNRPTGWASMGGRLTSGMGGTATAGNWFAYGLGTDNQVWEHEGTGGATGSWTRVTP